MQNKIGIRFHRADITYFEINRIYAYIKQIIYAKEFRCDKTSSMKQTIYQKLRNSNRNAFRFIPHVCYIPYHPWIAASESWSLRTQEHQHACPILLEFRNSSPPFCKNHKNAEVDKKIEACETLTLTESFVFSSCRCSKQSVSRLLTLNWSEHFIGWGFFQICSGNNYIVCF